MAATLKAATGAQYVQEAEFEFDNSVPDSLVDTTGAVTLFNKVGAAGPFDVIPLPYGAEAERPRAFKNEVRGFQENNRRRQIG